ncbi:MAG: ArnT family glycosyltransferase [Bacteroidales bacterium]
MSRKTNKKRTSKTEEVKSKIDLFLENNSILLLWIIVVTCALVSFLHFNFTVSISGDDSAYITRALDFMNEGAFPSFQGPIYPIFLSILICVFGVNVVALKFFSLIFMLAMLLFVYKAFKGKISNLSLFFSMIICSISYNVVFYSSQTFSEAMFMFELALLFYVFFRWIEKSKEVDLKRDIKYTVLLTALALIIFKTRTIGIGAIVSLVAYFAMKKDFKRLLYVIIGLVVVYFAFTWISDLLWTVSASGQASMLFDKDAYDASKGKEDFAGFIDRIVVNSNNYLSVHFLTAMGLRSLKALVAIPFLTVLLYIIYMWGGLSFIKKNKYLFFTSLFVAIMLLGTFISLQTFWNQSRLVIPFIPFMLILLVEALLVIGGKLKFKKLVPYLCGIIVIFCIGQTMYNFDSDRFYKGLSGDKYVGFTPDWVNYLKAAEYVGEEIPNAFVACRKPNMARIYGGGKKFYGIYKVPNENAVELLKRFKEAGVTHVAIASLRTNPNVNNGAVITTVRRYVGIIAKEFPNAFKPIKQIGETEGVTIYEINYN